MMVVGVQEKASARGDAGLRDRVAAPIFSHAPLVTLGLTGSGLAKFSALNSLYWTTQCPAVTSVAVTSDDITPPSIREFPRLSYVYRSNPRRVDLTWPEVTLLECAREQLFRDRTLDQFLAGLSLYLPQNQYGQPVRPDKLVWAAETEQVPTPACYDDLSFYQRVFDETIPPLAEALSKLDC